MLKILYVTGTRAEYGIVRPVLKRIIKEKDLKLQILATGMHLSKEFGNTYKEIERDGFQVDYKVEILLDSDSKAGMAKSYALAVLGFIQAYEQSMPDIVLICGDRVETHAAAIAAAFMTIPIIHLFGGDSAAGSNIDDSLRFSISKFAHVHLVAKESHKQRLLKMGEEPWRISVVGSPAIDTIVNRPRRKDAQILKEFGLDKKTPILLVLQHPTSIKAEESANEISEILAAVVSLKYQAVVIYPNSDAGGREMIKVIERYRKYNFIKIFKNLPHEKYLDLLQVVSVMIGNSSSGLIETPSFQLPVVNVGIRQKGRERSTNVLDAKPEKKEILKAIDCAMNDRAFLKVLKVSKNIYGDGHATERIIKILKNLKIDTKMKQKKIAY
jgi:GDP/UDP-N,N'-diacetylbacillosamine 2-epimerase (hydrolysing)